MRLACRIFMIAPFALLPASAFGISVINREATDQTLIVIEGDKQAEQIIKAGEQLTLCEKSCVIRLADGEDYEFDGPETVSLEDGLLFLDNAGEQGKAAQ